MGKRHLAIDIGASSGRAIVGEVDERGAMRLTEVHRFENGLHKAPDGHLCWDVDSLFRNVLEGLRAAKARGLVPATVGIDTWAVDFVLLDERDRLVGEAVGYRDGRTDGVREELESSGTLDFLEHYARTGIQYQPFNTAYQLFSLGREHPEQLDRARSLLMIPDYLNFLLTGRKASEYTNASTTALVGATSRTWDDELIERLGLPRGVFQGILMPGSSLGRLRPNIAEEVGFDAEVVLPATHDTGSAWLAVPSGDSGAAYISSGTWSLLGTTLDHPVTTPESARANFTNEGGYGGTYRYLKNIMGLWMIQSVRREARRSDGGLPTWGELVDAAKGAREKGFYAVVDAEDGRFLAPGSMTEEIVKACEETGQSVPLGTGEVALVVYDSLAQAYARSVERMSELTGVRYQSVNIVGGGSNNDYLNQATADACGLTVTAGPTEGTAIGNIMVQLVSSGEYTDMGEARGAIRKGFPLKEFVPQGM
jgi:rhamnulokinase